MRLWQEKLNKQYDRSGRNVGSASKLTIPQFCYYLVVFLLVLSSNLFIYLFFTSFLYEIWKGNHAPERSKLFLILLIDEIFRVRVANELGAGNGKGAKFATIVSVAQSTLIGLIFCVLIVMFHDKIANIFSSSTDVLQAVDGLSFLLATTILLNSVQPVLSG